jgi:hypothetical protein
MSDRSHLPERHRWRPVGKTSITVRALRLLKLKPGLTTVRNDGYKPDFALHQQSAHTYRL